MAPKCPAQSAARGTLSARQWSDIRQAARLARSEGIPIEMHGITLNSARGSPRPPGRVKAASKVPVPDKGNSSSMEIDDPTAETSKKKQQRDKQRSEDFRERRMLAVRWLPLVQRLLRRTRKKFCDDVWTTWMRSRLAPPPKNAKLRALLWREWTRPQLGSPAENPVLGLLSHRDDFIYARCIAFCRHIETMIEYPKPSDMDELCSFGLDGFDPNELQLALAASLEGAASAPGTSDDHAGQPGADHLQAGATRVAAEAGIPSTPASASNRKKKTRGGRS